MTDQSKNKLLYLIGFFASLLVPFELNATPVINEVMANNESTAPDVDGDFSDWIE
ncbi:MAG: hypothetical protein HN584_03365, partial [Akkermansiaceae bacterium]|nr:hypothetical protein [Akkermansiaceae bacterium]